VLTKLAFTLSKALLVVLCQSSVALAVTNGGARLTPSKLLNLNLGEVSQTDATFGNELKVFQNGSVSDPLRQLIGNSEKFIFVQLLSLACDSATEPFLTELERKSRAGTDVRLIVNKSYAWLSFLCLQRLSRANIKIQRLPTHSSYWVSDKGELLIGSQSLARMFLLSDGKNNMDRDLMLYARGALATDALRNFLSIWLDHNSEIDESLRAELTHTREALASEISQGSRRSTSENTKSCRFLSQKPNGTERSYEQTIQTLITNSEQKIIFSGVKFDWGSTTESPATQILVSLQKQSKSEVDVHYLGNGAAGGNGELTMVLNEWIQGSWLWQPLTWFRDFDSQRKNQQRSGQYRLLLQDSNIKVWNYSNFLHYKIWSFDNQAMVIGSANVSDESFNDNYESAVLCFDQNLQQNFENELLQDRASSALWTEQDYSK
jgi:phosphatidylserine/phosphatidylglycerophosphate/cardiolipin synthase-like enzyme